MCLRKTDERKISVRMASRGRRRNSTVLLALLAYLSELDRYTLVKKHVASSGRRRWRYLVNRVLASDGRASTERGYEKATRNCVEENDIPRARQFYESQTTMSNIFMHRR